MHDLFFELIQVAIGTRKRLSVSPSDKEWEELFMKSQQQTIAGVVFDGIQVLPKEQYPPKSLMFRWLALCEQIRRQNIVMDQRVREVSEIFGKAGFRSCILKGQGNAQMYPNPLSRTPGDIDIWIDGTRQEITDFVRSKVSDAYGQYQHIEFRIFKDVEVEVHYRPSRQNHPLYNRRLQQFYLQQRGLQCSHVCRTLDENGRVCTPTHGFNLIFQLSHIMNHFLIEGIGLRQLMDYYYLLRQGTSDVEREEYQRNIRKFGMRKFAASVMWVMKKIFETEEQYILVEPSEKGGRLLLNEIMSTGNFGKHDARYRFRNKGVIARTLTDLYRDMTLARVFPIEALCMPWVKIENQLHKSRR